MATRYTRSDLDAAFSVFCSAHDLKTGPAYIDGKANIGVHLIDNYHNEYKIVRIGCEGREGGGEWEPFGGRRYKLADMIHMLWFATDLKSYDPRA